MKYTDKSNAFSLYAIIILSIVGCTVYFNTLNVPFYFDDQVNILRPSLKMESLTLESVSNVLSDALLSTRPISNLSFAFNYFVGGEKVQGYHLVNIIIHILTSVLLFFLLHTTLLLPVNKTKFSNYNLLAFFPALLWLVHPVCTQSVTYIVQRMNSMAAMFFILSLLLYVKGRICQRNGYETSENLPPWFLYAGSIISGVFALGSKEIAATLPIIVFLYEWFFFQDLQWKWLKQKVYWLVLVTGCFFTVGYFYLGKAPWLVLFSECPSRDFTSYERFLTQFRVVTHYISILLFPAPSQLALDYNFSMSTSWFDPLTTMLSFFFLLCCVGGAVLLARRERLLSFCIFWFFINLAIESSVICLEMVFEHRTYLPSMFFLLLFVLVFCRCFAQAKVAIAIMTALGCLLSFWTIQRNETWLHPIMFWQDNIAKHPQKARPYVNLAKEYYREGNYDVAKKQLMIAYELDKKSEITLNNLGVLHKINGEYGKAETFFQESLQQKHNYIAALLNLSQLLLDEKRYGEASETLKKLLDKDPGNPAANMMMGSALVRQFEFDKSLPYLRTVQKWKKRDANVLLELGASFAGMGEFELAIKNYQKAIMLGSSKVKPFFNMAVIYGLQGNAERALYYYAKASQVLNPPLPVYYNVANIYYRAGDYEKAEEYYLKQLAEFALAANTYNNLGLVYVEKGELKKAVKCFYIAITIDPDNHTARENMTMATEQLEK